MTAVEIIALMADVDGLLAKVEPLCSVDYNRYHYCHSHLTSVKRELEALGGQLALDNLRRSLTYLGEPA